MLEISGYQVVESVHQGQNFAIYRGIETAKQQAVIIKAPNTKLPDTKGADQLRHEFEACRQVTSKYVVKYKELIPHATYGCVLIEEDGQTKALINYIPKDGFEPLIFLQIALQLAEGLYDIHHNNIVHNNITAGNIIVSAETPMTVKYINFANASPLHQVKRMTVSPHISASALAYLSPEQTGRTNRLLDYRTDFYSLGVIFYQLLCGQLPFLVKDSLELVHCHIARQPVAPHILKPGISLVLSQIIMKLLEKNAEDRYQSVYGIWEDLKHCSKELQEKGEIQRFPLAQHDIAERFSFPQKLYGREQELTSLKQALDRCSQPGAVEICLVTGYAGVGKSMLVSELRSHVDLKKGYFLVGKGEQLSRNLAYSVIKQAFQTWIKELLTYEEEKILLWKGELLEALGNQGQLLVDMIPELELIIGKQPPIPTLETEKTKNRFHLTFQNFIRAIAKPEHSLVLFLDDLQWIDEASLKLIEAIITSPEAQNLLFLGAYRDDEVHPSDPLSSTLKILQGASIKVQTIALRDLDLSGINHYLADALHASLEFTYPLTEVVYQKTGGNPFFVKAFLQAVYEQRLLTLTEGVWRWELEKIRQLPVTENIIGFMTHQLTQLPLAGQELLKLASCLGHRFTLAGLQLIAQKQEETLLATVQPLMAGGFLLQTNDYFQFAHDRIQEAAYQLVTEQERSAIHLTVGRILQTKLPLEANLDQLLEVVNHLNRGNPLINDQNERIAVAELNLEVGKKAKVAVAYRTALSYLHVAEGYLANADLWKERYSLAYVLHKELAEAEYLNGNFAQSQKYIDELLAYSSTNLEKAEIYNLLIVQKTLIAQYQQAIDIGYQALKVMGIDIPGQDLSSLLQSEVSQVEERLKNKTMQELLDAPLMTRADIKAIMKLLNSLVAPSYLLNNTLYELIILLMLDHTLQYGNTAESALGYVNYGVLLNVKLNEIERGHNFGLLGIQLGDKLHDFSSQCRTKGVHAAGLHFWRKPLREAEAYFDQALRAGLQAGESQMLGYLSHWRIFYFFYQGMPLTMIESELNKMLQRSYVRANQLALSCFQALRLTVLNLKGQTSGVAIFEDSVKSDVEYQAHWQQEKSFYVLANYLILKAQALYLHGQFAQALEALLSAKNYMAFVAGNIGVMANNFYYSLVLIALHSTSDTNTQHQYWQQLEANQKQLKIWADNCPENFLHKYLLIAAEVARMQNQDWQAAEQYDQAIQLAQEQGIILEYALACELAAKFWLTKDRAMCAQIYLYYAHNSYTQWGAKRKVDALIQQYPDLLKPIFSASHLSNFAISTDNILSASSLALIDLTSVLKASQTISSEIDLTKLLTSILKIIIQIAGAQKGAVLLYHHDHLMVEAEYAKDEQISLPHIPLENWEAGCHAIISYVQRTKQLVVLENALQDKLFAADNYIIRSQAKSILCMPVIKQDELKAMLYLENNLAYGAFTLDRVQILMILASQIAISLENSRLVRAKIDEKLLQEAQQYQKSQDKFINMICHEIRNPMVGIYGSVDFIKANISAIRTAIQSNYTTSDGYKETLIKELQALEESVDIIEKCTEHQKSVINSVLDFSKLKAQKLQLNLRPFRPGELMNDTVKMFLSSIAKKQLALQLALPEQEPLILSDPDRLKIVIVNLISNAVKFTQKGTITISLRLSEPTVQQVKLRISVRDTGIGMTPEEQSQLFKRFSTPVHSYAIQYEGSGLGLTIMKKLVELMGGDLHLESEKGVGTCFSVELTCDKVAKEEVPVVSRVTIPAPAPSSAKHILIVEDEPVNQAILSRQLKQAGHTFQIANNGREALKLWEESAFDLILMDTVMPEMDGLEATRQIRRLEQQRKKRHIPIIGVSANIQPVDVEVAKEAGMDDYVGKPYNKQLIYKRIAELTSASTQLPTTPSVPTAIALPADRTSLGQGVTLPSLPQTTALTSRYSDFYGELLKSHRLYGDNTLEKTLALSKEEQAVYHQQQEEALQQAAQAFGFACYNVPGDGSCFFHAVKDQLTRVNHASQRYSAAELHALAAQYVIDHLEDYMEFFDQDRDSFVDAMTREHAWAEEILIRALSRVLRMTLVIIRSDNADPTIIRQANAEATLYLGYSVDWHYESLINLKLNPAKNVNDFIKRTPIDPFQFAASRKRKHSGESSDQERLSKSAKAAQKSPQVLFPANAKIHSESTITTLLAQATISINPNSTISIIFRDHRLASQLQAKLKEEGIENLGMSDQPRKIQVLNINTDNEQYSIVLTQDEYAKITEKYKITCML